MNMNGSQKLKLYTLKPEFVTLFVNLAKGEALTEGDAFARAGQLKSVESEQEWLDRDKIMHLLVASGFLSEEESNIGYRSKP
jgi:hypothetical protein